jgi:fucose permease
MTLCLLLSLPVWKKNSPVKNKSGAADNAVTARGVLRKPGAKAALASFFCYCSLESSAGLWASSYMVLNRGITAETAAKWASIFYLGITIGRFLCGFITDKTGDKNMIRIGQGLMISGVLIMLLPFGNIVCFLGLIMIGLGCAPVYPCLLHETPHNFGRDMSQAIMGIQMACAYTGSTLMPPLFGLIAEHAGIALYPIYLMIFAIVMLLMVEKLNAASRRTAVSYEAYN